jgi:intracellular sulfur oxidation DsrE/DsrF family protein
MKKICLLLIVFAFTSSSLLAQNAEGLLSANKTFTGATAKHKKYHAIYQLDNADAKVIEKTFRNINNALKDPRLEGKIAIELITFSGGTEACMKGSKYEGDLIALVEKGVIVAQCNNSLKERKITREQLYDFIAIVPSGNGELIIRQSEGWAIIKP